MKIKTLIAMSLAAVMMSGNVMASDELTWHAGNVEELLKVAEAAVKTDKDLEALAGLVDIEAVLTKHPALTDVTAKTMMTHAKDEENAMEQGTAENALTLWKKLSDTVNTKLVVEEINENYEKQWKGDLLKQADSLKSSFLEAGLTKQLIADYSLKEHYTKKVAEVKLPDLNSFTASAKAKVSEAKSNKTELAEAQRLNRELQKRTTEVEKELEALKKAPNLSDDIIDISNDNRKWLTAKVENNKVKVHGTRGSLSGKDAQSVLCFLVKPEQHATLIIEMLKADDTLMTPVLESIKDLVPAETLKAVLNDPAVPSANVSGPQTNAETDENENPFGKRHSKTGNLPRASRMSDTWTNK